MSSPSLPDLDTAGFPVLAVVGGGQLARMMQQAAISLGVRIRLLTVAADDSAALVVPDCRVGHHTDLLALRALADGAQVMTFDHEHVPSDHLRALESDGVAVRPRAQALLHAQDKLVMRRRLAALDVRCPRWAEVRDVSELVAFGQVTGRPVVLKTPSGGYDGKGVVFLDSPEDATRAADWFARSPGELLLAEERVRYRRELSVLVARSPSGQAASWPVVETVQEGGVCTEVISPAPELAEEVAVAASGTALRLAAALDVTGVMAVEVFETDEGEVLVNELAMRPHNSGHWTIDGSVTSQFEQHIRAVLDLPLGETRARARWTVMANVLGGEHPDLYRSYLHVMAHDPAVKVHMYGKEVRAGRKVGHVTVTGDDLEDVRARARHAADFITGVIDE